VGIGRYEEFATGIRVRQGCSLSPLLYNIYDKALVREAIRDQKLASRLVVCQQIW